MKIRQLNRLETVNYSIDKIVEGERASILWPDFLVGDKIILVAHGEGGHHRGQLVLVRAEPCERHQTPDRGAVGVGQRADGGEDVGLGGAGLDVETTGQADRAGDMSVEIVE